jgi:hypothetical protein
MSAQRPALSRTLQRHGSISSGRDGSSALLGRTLLRSHRPVRSEFLNIRTSITRCGVSSKSRSPNVDLQQGHREARD